MSGLTFERAAPPATSAPNRMDVACFVGFIRRRDTSVSDRANAGTPGPTAGRSDSPTPVESWSEFDDRFAWDRRPLDGGGHCITTMGATVRSFFAEGGRRCWIVPVADPWPPSRPRHSRAPLHVLGAWRLGRLRCLLPGFPGPVASTEADPAAWRGIGWLFALPDVSCLCLPDLADIVRVPAARLSAARQLLPAAPQFVECSDGETATADSLPVPFDAPRADFESFSVWSTAIARIADFLDHRRREVELVAGIPIPAVGAESAVESILLRQDRPDPRIPDAPFDSMFVQLAYPWLRHVDGSGLPGGLEPPEGALAGVLARNALSRGAYHSAATLPVTSAADTWPALAQDELVVPADPARGRERRRALVERASLIGMTPTGMRVLSDVTTSLDESNRPAAVRRLVVSILRAARRLGEAVVFDASGEALWSRIRARLESLLLSLYNDGALRGASPEEAFRVRCDRTTMRQADIDDGRAIVEVTFAPALPIERIRLVLAFAASGSIGLVDRTGNVQEAA